MKKIFTLATSDFKLIFRDPSLRAFLVFPVIIFIIFIWVLPDLVEKHEFLTPYLSIMLMVGVIENTQMFGFINTMVLIDEKETDVAKMYGIVPMSKIQYLISRLIIPFLATFLLNVILLKVQTFYPISWVSNLAVSLLTAMLVPVYILGINSIVKNRIQGMIYIKAFNIAVLLPLGAFFLSGNYKLFFGFLPTYWIFESIENLTHNVPMIFPLFIGFGFFGFLLVWISKQFIKRHFV